MKAGDKVTVLTPLRNIGNGNRISAKRGIFLGWENGERIVQLEHGGRLMIPRGSIASLTTKHVDISPCGLKE